MVQNSYNLIPRLRLPRFPDLSIPLIALLLFVSMFKYHGIGLAGVQREIDYAEFKSARVMLAMIDI